MEATTQFCIQLLMIQLATECCDLKTQASSGAANIDHTIRVTRILYTGNHETTTCTTMYGFKGELDQKYGKLEGQAIYKSCKRLFATLPLAACINRATLVVHGGLFRKPTPAVPSRVSHLRLFNPHIDLRDFSAECNVQIFSTFHDGCK